ncbi:hypothetical protein [Silvibacterium dinghuense]|uniref:Uncharacterized protein n=1 Tax=Silvibacterium dinghuense TaxID=1560006 RepID=A0A4Q1S8X0_9BACT|nr:hypothetical protein [Silvibacterium dinghuense]RXS93434.1 hypothetical protein ESZ00_19010 [Silvibacterium dinghuense]GGH05762.1 hypothetical protein GCM10011586_22460 [Silvibacterium dinghuense]
MEAFWKKWADGNRRREKRTEIRTTRIEQTVEREVLSVVSVQHFQEDSPPADITAHPLFRSLSKTVHALRKKDEVQP